MKNYRREGCKYLVWAILIIVSKISFAQITVNNAEHYKIGARIVFQKCDWNLIDTGISGSNINWDYSKLVPLSDSLIVAVEDPSGTPYASKYAKANRVEVASDSSYVYSIQKDSSSHLTGYVAKSPAIKMILPKERLFMIRPITFGDKVKQEFTSEFESNGYDFRGIGVSSVESDGYGSLKLPNATYDNVLRVKIHSNQIDTLLQFNSTHRTSSTTYLWFDSLHPEPLLRISRNISSQGEEYSVGYLLRSNTLNVKNKIKPQAIRIFPNPTQDFCRINLETKSAEGLSYRVLDLNGRVCQVGNLGSSHLIDLRKLHAGCYYVVVKDGLEMHHTKIIKN